MKSRERKVRTYQNLQQAHLEATLCLQHEKRETPWFGRLGQVVRGQHSGYCDECDRQDSLDNATLCRKWDNGRRVG